MKRTPSFPPERQRTSQRRVGPWAIFRMKVPDSSNASAGWMQAPVAEMFKMVQSMTQQEFR